MTQPRITLVNMNMLFIRYREKVDRELHVPLGPLYLAAVLEEAGIPVDFRDYQVNFDDDPFEMASFLSFLDDPAPIVGFSCMANLLPFTILAIRVFKEAHPECTVVLGGVGPFSVERAILERFPWIECIAYGEFEPSIVKLVDTIEGGRSLTEVPGVYVRTAEGVVKTPAPLRMENLDKLPFPAFHHIDLRAYDGYGIMSSRGCPYPCTFCSVAPIWGHKPVVRSNESVIAEMREVRKHTDATLFLFQDEFFVASPERAESFAKELMASDLEVQWKAFGRINLSTRRAMEAMARAGCVELRFGVESGSDRVLALTKKGFTVEEAITVVSEAVQIVDRVDSFFIWGFPFETEEDFYQTVFTMLSFRLMGSRILPSLHTLLPQTAITLEYGDPSKLEFYPMLLPEYMLTGMETICDGHMEIEPAHQYIFDFIEGHPDIFTGFFNLDIEGIVKPRFAVLQEHGFYAQSQAGDVKTGADSCGAHSPKVQSDSRQEIFTRSR